VTTINIIQGDITKSTDIDSIEVIVNVTDRELSGRGGKVDKAIHKVAGEALAVECKKFSGCEAGEIKITNAFNLNCKKIFHIVNPKSEDTKTREKDLLKKSYYDCLLLAMREGIKTIAFPSIRTKKYKISSEAVAEIAIRTIKEFIKENPNVFDEIRFVLFDDKTKSEYEEIDEKGDRIFRYMEISVDLQISDYKNFVGAIMNLIKGNKPKKQSKENEDEMFNEEDKKKTWKDNIVDSSIDGMFYSFEWILNDLGGDELVQNVLEKNLLSKLGMKSIKVKNLDYKKKEKGELSVCIGVSEYDYAEIFTFLSKIVNDSIVKKLKKKAKNKIEENQNTEEIKIADGYEIQMDDPILKIVSPALEVMEEVIPDDLKDELITKVINACPEAICEFLEDKLKEKNLDILLNNLHCKSSY